MISIRLKIKGREQELEKDGKCFRRTRERKKGARCLVWRSINSNVNDFKGKMTISFNDYYKHSAAYVEMYPLLYYTRRNSFSRNIPGSETCTPPAENLYEL